MICPKCGSSHILTQSEATSVTEEKQRGYSCIRGCLGLIFFQLPGLLCGLCGMGKEKRTTRTTERIVHLCQDCGHRF